MARSSQQYKPKPRQDDEALRLALIQRSKQYGRYGYRKVAKLLRVEGCNVNYKKVERLWREEGLQFLVRHKRRKTIGAGQVSARLLILSAEHRKL